MMNWKWLVVVIVFLSSNLSSQVNWISWEEALELNEQEPRKFVVEVYTDWCQYCKKMEESTFQDKRIINYINKNFYAIRFDAETKRDIIVNDKSYHFMRSGRRGYHELAYMITRGHLQYPSVVFLQENLKVIQSIEGYRGPDQLAKIMVFFGDDFYQNTPWNEFLKKSNSYLPVND